MTAKKVRRSEQRTLRLETLERRELLAFDVAWNPATQSLGLTVLGIEPAELRLRDEGGFVADSEGPLVTTDGSATSIASADVVTVVIIGGPNDDVVDLSSLNLTEFASLYSVSATTLDGHDQFIGSFVSDFVQLGAGNDFANSLDGNDEIFAGVGDDFVFAGSGNDEVHGESGNDNLYGNDGADELFGGDGQDLLAGEAGNDLL